MPTTYWKPHPLGWGPFTFIYPFIVVLAFLIGVAMTSAYYRITYPIIGYAISSKADANRKNNGGDDL